VKKRRGVEHIYGEEERELVRRFGTSLLSHLLEDDLPRSAQIKAELALERGHDIFITLFGVDNVNPRFWN
jgi:hypothetical protein